jgi:hypothetical protein
MKTSLRRFAALAALALFAAAALFAQQTVDNSTAARVLPYPVRTYFPGACVYGEMMIYSPGTAGANTYVCGATNNWVSDGGGGADPCSQSIGSLPSGLHCATVTLAQSDILALDSTPFVLIPAQGAGTVIFPLAVRWKHTWAAYPYLETNTTYGGPALWWGNRSNAFGTIASFNAIFALGFGLPATPHTDAAFYYSGLSAAYSNVGGVIPSAYANIPVVAQLYSGETLNAGPVASVVSITTPGSGYAVGEEVGADGTALLTVSSVSGGGGVTGLTITTPGLGNTPGSQALNVLGNVLAAVPNVGFPGTGYSNGDTGVINGCGHGNASYVVLTSLAGVVQTVAASGGDSYASPQTCATSVSTGTGDGTLQLDITSAATGDTTLAANLTVQSGDGSVTVTSWYLVAAE